MQLLIALSSAEDTLNERIRAQRKKLQDIRRQLQLFNRIRPLRASIKRNLTTAKNTKDDNTLKRLKVERRNAAARIAVLEKSLTSKSSEAQLKEQLKRQSERLNDLNAKLRELRTAA